MVSHNVEFAELEEAYIQMRRILPDKARIILGKMYDLCVDCAKNYIRKIQERKGLLFLDLSIASHDAAMFIIEQYLSKEAFRVQKVSSYLYFGVIKTLFGNAKKERMEVSYEAYIEEQEAGEAG
jgi:hypothetical protein